MCLGAFYDVFPALSQYLGGWKYKDVSAMETVVT